MDSYIFTVFTPSYNRANTLPRLFECLKNQTLKSFEWIIINDGSQDETEKVVKGFINENPDFEIIYKYQTNSGKHIATNEAAKMARGKFFITIDSDDAIKDNALEILLNKWNKIPESEREKFKGVSCRTCNTDNKINGCSLPSEYVDCSDLDFRFKNKITGELWGMTRLEIIKNHPYPTVKGLHFYPENIYWNNIGRKYITRFIDLPLRIYINDQANALTDKNNSSYKETLFMRIHFINECWDYFKYNPKYFVKQIIGLNRDGLLNNKKFKEIIKIPNTGVKKLLTFLTYPIGYILYKKQSGR